MDVLEAAVGDVRHLDSEVLGHLRVPGFGDIGGGEPAARRLLLQFEAEDDVEVVGDLVGVDTDQRRLDAIDRL